MIHCDVATEAHVFSHLLKSFWDQFLYKWCIKCVFGKGYLQCIDSATASLVEKFSLQIQTLTYSQAIAPLTADQPVPQGCAVAISSDRCTVNLMLKVTTCSCFIYFFPHCVFLVGVPGVKRGFLLINLKMNGEQPHWLRQLYHSHQNLIVIPGSHWYREGSHQAGGETRWFGETGGEAEGEDVKEWLQGEGAIEGARAGCWEGEKRSFVLGCFFFWGGGAQGGNCSSDSTPFSLTAPAESNWTWKSERSRRELQENDVIVSPVIQHYAREEFVAMLLMSMLALTVIMYFFLFSFGISVQAVALKELNLYMDFIFSFCPPVDSVWHLWVTHKWAQTFASAYLIGCCRHSTSLFMKTCWGNFICLCVFFSKI